MLAWILAAAALLGANPAPVPIKTVIEQHAAESGRRIILDRNVQGRVPAGLPYLAALDQAGLAESDLGEVVQIRPKRSLLRLHEPRMPAPPLDPAGTAQLHFPEPTDIRDILVAARSWYGHELVLDPEVKGKLQILAPDPMTKDVAYQVLVAALDVLGLTTVVENGAVRILPYRKAK